MIVKRSIHVAEPNNVWAICGGAIDGNEIPIEASLREIKEELNVTIKVLKSHLLFIFRKGSFRYFNFLHEVEDEFKPFLNWENSDYKWITRNQLFGLLTAYDVHFGLKTCLSNKNAKTIIESL